MTSRDSLARLALRELADAPPEIEPPSPGDAEDAVAAIARELAAVRARRRRRGAVLASIAVAAAAAAIAVGVGSFAKNPGDVAKVETVSGGVVVMRGEDGVKLGPGATVAKGDRVVASAAASATLRLPKGTELRALAGADVLVVDQGRDEIFELRAGSVQLHVAKLVSGDRFIVRTSDSEVEVRGTQFRVDVGPPCEGTTTRVVVTEGTVVVRHGGAETHVTANQSWPSHCETQAAAPTAPASALAVDPPPAVTSARPIVQATAPKRTNVASSDLAEQNRIFADAMAAKRRGDAPAALAALDRLASAYPQGPLAESAAVERMRILAASEPARGAEAARAYLSRYPDGYARAEAQHLLGAP